MKSLKIIFGVLLMGSSFAQASLTESQDKETSSIESLGVVNSIYFFEKNYTPAQRPPAPKSAEIYGEDDRVVVKSRKYPWSSLGGISYEDDDKEFCTFSMVSACHALTAAHCMEDKGNFPVSIFRGANGGAASSWDYFRYGGGNFVRNRVNDWAVVRLTKSIGKSIGWFGVRNVTGKNIDFTRKYNLAGYSSDWNENGGIATVDQGVEMVSYVHGNINRIYYRADSYSGASGSPIFYFDDKRTPWIVGIHTTGPPDVTYLWGLISYPAELDADTTKVSELTGGIAVGQFFDEMTKFMKEYPCD